MLDALERDLAGPVVFPLSDGAEVDVAHVGTPRSVQDRSHSESASVENQVVSDDIESMHGEGSVVSGEEELVPPTEPDPVVTVGGVNPAIRAALIWMDEVDLEVEFCRRAAVFKSIPHFLRGPYRSAMRLAMEEANQGNNQRRERGGRGKLAQRFDDFFQGRWRALLVASRKCAEEASVIQ